MAKILTSGIGVHWGSAVVGDIGAGESKRFTAIGDSMNFASRVESANKQFKSRVLISDDIYQEVKNNVVVKDHMRTMVKGIEGRVTLHEVEQIHMSKEIEKLESIQKTEDGINWRKFEKVESFDSEPQQVFRINRENILVVKVDDEFSCYK